MADEVRTLAQRSGQATTEIESLLSEITRETADSVIAMESTLPKIEKGLALGVNSVELLKEIETNTNNSLLNIQQVVSALNKQIIAIDELASNFKNTIAYLKT
ncbi:MAG: hypothetical protein HRU25_09040 [Psychrobium sp.]|nr:hypothetical protein [Psychrobium sp.]